MATGTATTLTRYGGWLPANPDVQTGFIRQQIALSKTAYNTRAAHTAPVTQFQAAINADPEMVDLWKQIFLQVSSQNEVRCCFSLVSNVIYVLMLLLRSRILTNCSM